ncbi:hypothetical protein FSP39_000040 [Pinctada imbricata]|uniref:Uncharacterized protein n=1 Tax=Pinctada imbricata TaxID=66713 RepID=A0AA88XE79_PINIB|nr:hypothetical protein FSP39_000040 [Pinctada imbricata]
MIRLWAEKAKERAYMRHGPSKSTLKRTRFSSGPLVSHGEPVVDGFTKSPMTGKAKADNKEKDRKKAMETFFEVYGLKDDPEQYFRQMGALENFKNLKLRRNTKWGNMLDKSDMGARFTSGLFPQGDDKAIEEVGFENRQKAGSRRNSIMSKNTRVGTQISVTTDAAISEDGDPLPPVRAGPLRSRVPTISEGSIPETEGKRKMSAAKPAFMGKGTKGKKTESTANEIAEESEPEEDNSKVPKLPSIHKRSRRISHNAQDDSENLDKIDEGRERKVSKSKFFQTPADKTEERSNLGQSLPNLQSLDKVKSIAETDTERASSPTNTNKTQSSRKSRKRKRITSAILLSQAKAADGAVPLPLISQENQSRPFFYHNGKREEDVVIPIMDLVTKHQGTSSRDRAIKSLTIANSFKEKPWLTQVRMALSLTSQSIKRSIKDEVNGLRDRNESFSSTQTTDTAY